MPRLIYILPAFLIIVSSLIIITHTTKVLPQQRDNPQASQLPTDGWQTYTNPNLGINFSFPPILSVTNQSDTITLTHSLPLSHPNPCDFVGDYPQLLSQFTDFNIVFEVSPTDLMTTVRAKEDGLLDEYISQNTLLTSPGFIDPVSIGQLTGYKIFRGVEGCGNHIYYLSSSPTQTLIIRRDTIPEFSGGVSDYEKYLSISGVISPAQEEQIITRILSTFKFLEASNATDWKTYRNEAYGFKVKYPKDFFVSSEGPHETYNYDFWVIFTPEEWKNKGVHNPFVGVSVVKTNLSSAQWLDAVGTSVSVFDDLNTLTEEERERTKNAIYFGVQDVRYEKTDITSDGQIVKFSESRTSGLDYHVLMKGENNLLFNVHNHFSPNGEVPSDTFDQILSTFKFSDR